MSFYLSERSKERLLNVHPDLVRVVERAIKITDIDFSVLEGDRTEERQKQLFNAGASKTLLSRHISKNQECGYACAVDLGAYISGEIRWDWPLYSQIAKAMKEAAQIEDVKLEWGGDWVSFKDGPHFQLPKAFYP